MTSPHITAKALRLLARQIQAPDEIPAMCLSNAADLIERQEAEHDTLRQHIAEQDLRIAGIEAERDHFRQGAAIARAHRARLAAMLVSHTLTQCSRCEGLDLDSTDDTRPCPCCKGVGTCYPAEVTELLDEIGREMPNPQDHPGRSPRVHPVVGPLSGSEQ